MVAVLAEQRIAAVVFGMPYHTDGSRSAGCDIVERQAARLQAARLRRHPQARARERAAMHIASRKAVPPGCVAFSGAREQCTWALCSPSHVPRHADSRQ